MGVVSAILKFSGVNLMMSEWHSSFGAETLSIVAYGALIGFFIWFVLKDKKSN